MPSLRQDSRNAPCIVRPQIPQLSIPRRLYRLVVPFGMRVRGLAPLDSRLVAASNTSSVTSGSLDRPIGPDPIALVLPTHDGSVAGGQPGLGQERAPVTAGIASSPTSEQAAANGRSL